jgi:hypothetical protein
VLAKEIRKPIVSACKIFLFSTVSIKGVKTMPVKNTSCTLVQFRLDHKQNATPTDTLDLMRLATCTDTRDITDLVVDPHTWLCNVFLKGALPTEKNMISLLGPDYKLVTLEFVYPVQATGTRPVVVQLIDGTNVVTVRTSVSGGEKLIDLVEDPVHVTLYSLPNDEKEGLAYCHHHLDGTNVLALRRAVADIIRDPHQHLTNMGHKMPLVSRVPVLGASEEPPRPAPVRFGIKQHGSKARRKGKNKASVAAPELRFIYQCEWRGTEPAADDTGTLLPCIKPSGTFQVVNGIIIFYIDTIVVVDYASPIL